MNIPGATGQTFVLILDSDDHFGTYTCEISNVAGKVLWDEAIVERSREEIAADGMKMKAEAKAEAEVVVLGRPAEAVVTALTPSLPAPSSRPSAIPSWAKNSTSSISTGDICEQHPVTAPPLPSLEVCSTFRPEKEEECQPPCIPAAFLMSQSPHSHHHRRMGASTKGKVM